ncbi:alpha-beta hydrolase superfamily lysophospholipase [Microbacterium sp. AK009]|uniref:alpha/beta fold hydrolase n=1 Tax=Microbacterium sp. AK009 TaxID=2723068 RepID=UPI0015CED5F6|nr:alpha/beta fold hydrolase [Microbacterium sp. AK009]NYF16855.1 alpha-beta hydrolase superfamily lysophospholipase [Microbacterium sp. AK009]
MPEFIDAHGITIQYDLHPASSPRGVVQLLHGVGEHVGRYGALIGALVGAGWTVYAADHRGHGRTGMAQHRDDASRLGHLGVGGVRATMAAIWQLTQTIREDNPGLPLVVFGHSGGSFLAQMLLDEHPDAIDAMILSGSALRTVRDLRAVNLNKRWNGPEATGLEWLASDPAVGRAFRADPLTTEATPMQLFGPIEVLKIMGRPRRNLGHDIPMLLMVGRDDPVGGPRSVHKLAAAYRERSGLTDVTTLVYPDVRHEILQDRTQAEVRADLLAWLDARFAARD